MHKQEMKEGINYMLNKLSKNDLVHVWEVVESRAYPYKGRGR
jgi:hypothetical protein